MAQALRQYDSISALHLLYGEIYHSLTPEQHARVVDRLATYPEALEIAGRVLELPDPIKLEDIPEDMTLAPGALLGDAILSEIPEVALDPEKRDVLTLLSEVVYCLMLVKQCAGVSEKLSALELARIELANERFHEKPFTERTTHIKYEYDKALIPSFMEEQFKKAVGDKLLDALEKDPDANLRPYEDELGIAITDVKAHGRRKASKKLRDVIL